MVERADRAPVATFFAPEPWGATVPLGEAASHHAHVKRLRTGDVVRLTDGTGRRAIGILDALSKRGAKVALAERDVEQVPSPARVTLLAPVGDRERMLMLAEKAVELGVSSWQPVTYHRSRSVSPRGEGEAFREKVRLRMINALEQSGGAWLPELHPEISVDDASAVGERGGGLLLDGAGTPLLALCATLAAPAVLAIGPEGGLEVAERDLFIAAGWRLASLGRNVLRFETAGIAALAVVRAHLSSLPHG